MLNTTDIPCADVHWFIGMRIVYTGDAADQTFVRLGYCYEAATERLLAVEPAWCDDAPLGQSLAMSAVWQTFLNDNLRRPRVVFVPTTGFARGVLDALGDEPTVQLFAGTPPGPFNREIHRLTRTQTLPIRPYRGRLLHPACRDGIDDQSPPFPRPQ